MSKEGLSDPQNQLLSTYCGTDIETICRELSAVDNPDVDPNHRPQALSGLPWWTMKIPKALKYRPLLEKAWDKGYVSGKSNTMRRMSDEPNAPVTPNPYRQETDR